jgi:anti-sigma-K factor RskA
MTFVIELRAPTSTGSTFTVTLEPSGGEAPNQRSGFATIVTWAHIPMAPVRD